jgi:hypothetical protein
MNGLLSTQVLTERRALEAPITASPGTSCAIPAPLLLLMALAFAWGFMKKLKAA